MSLINGKIILIWTIIFGCQWISAQNPPKERLVSTEPLAAEIPSNLWLTQMFDPWVKQVKALSGSTTTTEAPGQPKTYIKTYMSANETGEEDQLMSNASLTTHTPKGILDLSADEDEDLEKKTPRPRALQTPDLLANKTEMFRDEDSAENGNIGGKQRYLGRVRVIGLEDKIDAGLPKPWGAQPFNIKDKKEFKET